MKKAGSYYKPGVKIVVVFMAPLVPFMITAYVLKIFITEKVLSKNQNP